MGLGCSPHKYTCYILSEDLVSSIFQAYSSKKEGIVLMYIKKVNYIHGIGLKTTYGHQQYGGIFFNVGAMFDQSYIALPVLQNIWHNFFTRKIYHCTCFTIL